MEIIVKSAIAVIVGSILALLLKKDSPVMAFAVTAVMVCAVVYLAAGVWDEIAEFIYLLSETAGVSSAALTAVLKTVGIAIVTKIASDVCRDASQNAAATSVELAGSAVALYVAMPFMKTVFGMVESLMK
jgi:stage III sporulation protein AD